MSPLQTERFESWECLARASASMTQTRTLSIERMLYILPKKRGEQSLSCEHSELFIILSRGRIERERFGEP